MLWAADLDALLADPALRGAQVGVCVTDGHGVPLYQKNAEVRFLPASNQKVLTALFALDTLGSAYRPKTLFWKTRTALEVQAPGDPTISLSDLAAVRKKLSLFEGLPVRVHSRYRQSLGPGWEWDDLDQGYAAATSPLSFDRGVFEVWAESHTLAPLPFPLGVKVHRGGGSSVAFNLKAGVLTVGTDLPSRRSRLGVFAQPDPFQAACRALGGKGEFTDEPVPGTAPDMVHEGRRLAEVLADCLERSDNAVAERLLFLAAEQGAGPLDYRSAARSMSEWLHTRVGLPNGAFKIADGSGLSRHNLVTPLALCQGLDWARSQAFWPVWLSCLPSGGQGTLRDRLEHSDFRGKTGTMDAVVCLCGYVTTSDGQALTFSFLVNGALASPAAVRGVQDRFVGALRRGVTLCRLSTGLTRRRERSSPPGRSPSCCSSASSTS